MFALTMGFRAARKFGQNPERCAVPDTREGAWLRYLLLKLNHAQRRFRAPLRERVSTI
jgi:hypothetical protein